MKRIESLWLLVATVALLVACSAPLEETAVEPALDNSAAQAAPTDVPLNCLLNTVVVAPVLTADNPNQPQQADVNCYAWQTFIALNWTADPNHRGQADTSVPPSQFGTPGDLSLTAWQTYKPAQDVFLPGAAVPPAWQTPDTIPPACQSAAGSDVPLTVLHMTAKASTEEELFEITQATGQILVDQSGRLIYYEKRMNEDEYNYVVTNKLYDADQQQVLATNSGISLPAGATSYGMDGAIEIKAAWRILDGESPAVQARYKQTTAVLYDAGTGSCSPPTLLGLIALHIIHKTPSMQQFMWSTFEHVDNAPSQSDPHTAAVAYTLYNPACAAPDSCEPNATPQPTVTPPAMPTLQPVQVERQLPLTDDVTTLNTAVHDLIRQANSASVWQYYRLVNVLWPKNSGPNPGKGQTIPISTATSGFTASGNDQPVSNLALETYVQTTTCIACHQFGGIAPSAAAGCRPTLAADFSFMLNDADSAAHFRQSCN